MTNMLWRDLTEPEEQALDDQLRDLAWGWTRRLAGLGYEDPPWSISDPVETQEEQASRELAMIHTMSLIRSLLDKEMDGYAFHAAKTRAVGYREIAEAAGVTQRTARTRFPLAKVALDLKKTTEQ